MPSLRELSNTLEQWSLRKRFTDRSRSPVREPYICDGQTRSSIKNASVESRFENESERSRSQVREPYSYDGQTRSSIKNVLIEPLSENASSTSHRRQDRSFTAADGSSVQSSFPSTDRFQKSRSPTGTQSGPLFCPKETI